MFWQRSGSPNSARPVWFGCSACRQTVPGLSHQQIDLSRGGFAGSLRSPRASRSSRLQQICAERFVPSAGAGPVALGKAPGSDLFRRQTGCRNAVLAGCAPSYSGMEGKDTVSHGPHGRKFRRRKRDAAGSFFSQLQEEKPRHFPGTIPALAFETGQLSHSIGGPCTTEYSRQGPAWVAGPKSCSGVCKHFSNLTAAGH